MFGMGFTEIMLIAIIAVLFMGPEKLPQAMVDIARFFRKVKGTIADTKEDLERELQISDLKAEMLSYKSQLDDMTNEVKGVTSGSLIKDEIEDINKTIKDVATLPQSQGEETTTPQTPKEPEREVVTFKKKKTPIQKSDDTVTDEKSKEA